MAKVLYIEASPRKKRSSSIAIARAFLEEYKKEHPNDEVVELDLWKKKLPEFDGDVIDSKYAILHGHPHTEKQRGAWKQVEEVIDEFKNADKYVFSLPMWNFGIPYKLKHYFDVLVQPGYTFTADQEGYKGLVTNKPILVVYSRGGAYGTETGAQGLDLQKKYMETILNFIGFENFKSLVIEPTLAETEKKELSMKAAKENAKHIARIF
jgi:FMN-dependent NADH-azoreductase